MKSPGHNDNLRPPVNICAIIFNRLRVILNVRALVVGERFLGLMVVSGCNNFYITRNDEVL